MIEDVRSYDAVKESLRNGKEELVSIDVVDRLLGGENPVKVWREYRGLSTSQLAKACNLSPAAISQIEKGKRGPSVETLKAIAAALDVDVDDLID